jgi:hypothetical protein
MRYLMLVKGFENAGPPPQALMDAIAALSTDAATSGTMLGSGGLLPSAAASRVRLSNGKITVIDGPFAEAKEVIGGYGMFELPSKEAAISAATRFMELHRRHWPGWDGETEVRPMVDGPGT